MQKIHADILIEDLVRAFPETIKILSEKGIRCLACGEPIWGTLGDAAKSRGYSEGEIKELIAELNLKFSD
jgi:methionine synthase II (cobalamin-independent)